MLTNVMLAGACIRLEIILFRFTVCGLLTAKIRLLSPAGAGALAELGNNVIHPGMIRH